MSDRTAFPSLRTAAAVAAGVLLAVGVPAASAAAPHAVAGGVDLAVSTVQSTAVPGTPTVQAMC
ncbi:hypothetical protein [Streptomyces sp. NPDC051546]|uniref:hypothetical protein n=1 Tax=Streptomyces sp. NPDC051546 TaxID=3365655 RepID=UPI00379BA46D